MATNTGKEEKASRATRSADRCTAAFLRPGLCGLDYELGAGGSFVALSGAPRPLMGVPLP